MTKKIIALLLLAAVPSFAANLPQAASVLQTGYGVDTAVPSDARPNVSGARAARITLMGGVNSGASGRYYKLTLAASHSTDGANYQVTSGKTLYCDGFYGTAASAGGISFGYGTASVTDNDSTNPTGLKLYSINDAIYFQAAVNMKWFPVPMSFPSQSYPFVKNTSEAANAFTVQMLCIEE